MHRILFACGVAALMAGGATAARAAAGAAFPNVDVRAITPPDDVTERQLRAQGTPNNEQPPTGVMQFIFPQMYAVPDTSPTGAYVSQAEPQADGTVAPAPTRRVGNPLTRYFLPGLQGNPAGAATVGGIER